MVERWEVSEGCKGVGASFQRLVRKSTGYSTSLRIQDGVGVVRNSLEKDSHRDNNKSVCF